MSWSVLLAVIFWGFSFIATKVALREVDFFWYSALEKRDSSTVGMHLYLIPLVTLTGSFLLLREEIKLTTLTGGGMILAGVYLATRRISGHLRTKNLDMPVN